MRKMQICFLFCIVSTLNAGKVITKAENPDSLWLEVYKQMKLSLKLDKSEQLFYQWKNFDSKEPFFKEFSESTFLNQFQQQYSPKKGNILIIGLNSDEKLDLSLLSELPQLDALTLYVRNADLSKIPQNIKFLSFCKTNLESLASMPNMPKTKSLYLSKMPINVNWGKFFAKLPNLKVLFWYLPPDNLKLDAQSFPELEYLIVKRFNTISLSPNLNLKGLAMSFGYNSHLPDFKGLKLEELIIKDSSELKDYSSISSLTSLQRLIINKTPLNDWNFLKDMQLDYLDIRDTPLANAKIPKWLKVKTIINRVC